MKLLKEYSPEEEVEGIQVMCLWTIATAQFLIQDFAENKSKMEKMKTEFAYVDKLKGELARMKADLVEAKDAREKVASQVFDLERRAGEAKEKLKTASVEKEALETELSFEKASGLKLKEQNDELT